MSFELFLDAKNVQQGEGELNASAGELERASGDASEFAKTIFGKMFVSSSSNNEAPPDHPLLPFKRHVDAMHAAKGQMKGESKEESAEYAVHLQLVTTACSAATERLRTLQNLEEFHKNSVKVIECNVAVKLPPPTRGIEKPTGGPR